MKNRIFPTILISFSGLILPGCASLSALDGPYLFDSDNDNQTHQTPAAPEPTREPASDPLSSIDAAISYQDLILGMKMEDVRAAWGEPSDVETAGNPVFGNQRWVYSLGSPSQFQTANVRIIYFEDGRLAGWETKTQ